MKTEIEQLIDRLADKSLTRGCLLYKAIDKLTVRIDFTYEHTQNGITEEKIVASCETFMADKPKPFYFNRTPEEENYIILGHPILIGDVLERLQQKAALHSIELTVTYIVNLWAACDLVKSLQSIFEEAEWEEFKECQRRHDGTGRACVNCERFNGCGKYVSIYKIKQPHIRELFQFLIDLQLTK